MLYEYLKTVITSKRCHITLCISLQYYLVKYNFNVSYQTQGDGVLH